MSKNAIIIGAGPAGLTAAYEFLTKTDIHPIILEETEEIGGISKTVKYKGNRMDIGGHRFFSKDDRVMKFWKELMPVQGKEAFDDKILGREKTLSENGPDPEKEDNVMLVRDRVSRIFYLRKFFDYPVSMKFETLKNMGFIRTMNSGFGYLFSAMFKRQEESLEDFMVNRFGTPLYHMFFEDYTEKLWGRHPSEIGADWGAQRIKGLSLMKTVTTQIKKIFGNNTQVETSLIEQFIYPKKGPGQLWELLADKITKLGGEIKKGCKVEKINYQGNKVTSLGINNNGNIEEISGDYYISSMPIKDLIAGMGEEVPENVKEVAAGLPYRDFMTVGVLVKKLKLENKTNMKTLANIVPDCWIYVQERDVKIGRIQIFNNWSPYMVENPEENIWMGLEYFCNEGDDFWKMSDQEFIDFAISELVKIDIIDKEDVLDSVKFNVKKAYPAYFDTYKRFDEAKEYLNTFDNLYCIGRNGQHRYNNMDHSMATGMEVVKVIKEGKNDKSIIWNVNTEKEYHEEK